MQYADSGMDAKGPWSVEFFSRLRFLFLFAPVTLLLPAGIGAITPVQAYGQLQVKVDKIVDQSGNSVVLNGMALFWSQWMPQYYNAACVKWLADDWKCTIIRASMAVDQGGYAANPAAETAKVKAVVDAAIAAGLYVVIDFHVHDARPYLTQAKTFFKEMSAAYGSYPNVIYETWNEPLPEHSWSGAIKPYHEEVIRIIRANDADNLILCGTRSWSQDVEEAAQDPIKASTNILYTLHYYAGTHRQSYRDKAAKALQGGIALMVTEGGLSEASGTGNVDTDEAGRWQDFLTGNAISGMNWSVADKNETSAALKSGAAGTGGWNNGQLTQSGLWVRDNLRKLYDFHALRGPTSLRNPDSGPILRALPDGRLEWIDALGRPARSEKRFGLPDQAQTPR